MEAVEKIEEEEKAAHFATLNSNQLTAIVANSEAKGTKRNTKWCVKNVRIKAQGAASRGQRKRSAQAVIESKDLIKLNNSPFMSPNAPAGLLRKVVFFCTLFWCRRGIEGLRLLRRDSFQLQKDADGIDYATMSHEELSKNHQGGFTDKSSDERQIRLYSRPGRRCVFLLSHLDKLNPRQQAFFQKPREKFE